MNERQTTATIGNTTLTQERLLGNPELPISDYRDEIVDSVNKHQAVVLTAETGAGKSTQLPQFLAEEGYEVVVTQPRVVAARSLAERVGAEVQAVCGEEFSDYVGYRTAREHGDADANQILYVTDGLQLVRQLADKKPDGKKRILVLDEVHEWNENMEVLTAWCKKRISEDPDFKVCMMSATMEAEPLARYLSGSNGRDVPVIEVPGRTFEITKKEGGSVVDETVRFAQEGKNTLVFVPGKGEIDQIIQQVEAAKIPNAVVLPLHGQLEKEEQRKVFEEYDGPKIIVATNVAQTSITIDGIDAVVDSGLERRIEVHNGVEGLYLRPISRADCLQRAGRAGRTKPGEYTLASLQGRELTPLASRPEYGTPEILNTRLEGMVLRLAKNGLDAAELEFYHQPDQGKIAAAKQRLEKLGALTGDGAITRIGRQMDRMPLESHYARTMIEARKYSIEVQMQVAAMLATQEAGGITTGDGEWRQLTSGDNSSDMITQLEVFIAAEQLSREERKAYSIGGKRFNEARAIFRELRTKGSIPGGELEIPTEQQREQLVRCIIAGMVDDLYVKSSYGGYSRDGYSTRDISRRSVVAGNGGEMVVGTPIDIQTQRGSVVRLLQSVTRVPSWEVLCEVAPQLVEVQSSAPFYHHEMGGIAVHESVRFGTQEAGTHTVQAEVTPETVEQFWQEMIKQTYGRLLVTQQALQKRTPYELPKIDKEEVTEQIRELITDVVARGDLTDEQAAQLTRMGLLEEYYGSDAVKELEAASPNSIQIGDRERPVTYIEGQPYVGLPVGLMHYTRDLNVLLQELPVSLPDGRKVGLHEYGQKKDLSSMWLDADAQQERTMRQQWLGGNVPDESLARREVEPGVFEVYLGATPYYNYPILGYEVDPSVYPTRQGRRGVYRVGSQTQLYSELQASQMHAAEQTAIKKRHEVEMRELKQLHDKFTSLEELIAKFDDGNLSDALLNRINDLKGRVSLAPHSVSGIDSIPASESLYEALMEEYDILKANIQADRERRRSPASAADLDALKARFNR